MVKMSLFLWVGCPQTKLENHEICKPGYEVQMWWKCHNMSAIDWYLTFFNGEDVPHKSPIVGVRLSEAPKRIFHSWYIKIVWGIQIQCQTNHKSVLLREKGDFSPSTSKKILFRSFKMPIRPISCYFRDLKVPEMDFSDHFTY